MLLKFLDIFWDCVDLIICGLGLVGGFVFLNLWIFIVLDFLMFICSLIVIGLLLDWFMVFVFIFVVECIDVNLEILLEVNRFDELLLGIKKIFLLDVIWGDLSFFLDLGLLIIIDFWCLLFKLGFFIGEVGEVLFKKGFFNFKVFNFWCVEIWVLGDGVVDNGKFLERDGLNFWLIVWLIVCNM